MSLKLSIRSFSFACFRFVQEAAAGLPVQVKSGGAGSPADTSSVTSEDSDDSDDDHDDDKDESVSKMLYLFLLRNPCQ